MLNALGLLAILTTAAAAGPNPAMSGSWQIDLDASDPVDAILEAQGASWLERKAARTVKVTQQITVAGTTVNIVTKGGGKTRNEEVVGDGLARQLDGKLGAMTVTAQWSEAGDLIGVTVVSGESPLTATVTRHLVDDATLHQVIELQTAGETLQATRVFRRTGP